MTFADDSVLLSHLYGSQQDPGPAVQDLMTYSLITHYSFNSHTNHMCWGRAGGLPRVS